MIHDLPKYEFERSVLKIIPEIPGVYIYFDKDGKMIYIGKAKSLKNRIGSYFNKNIFGKTDRLVKNIKQLSFIKVQSEIESILLEAKLIKLEKPYYNLALKDDKGPSFVYLTKEIFSRILVDRKSPKNIPVKYVFGPFSNTKQLNMILKNLRRIIPYSNHIPATRPCLYRQIGLCNPCPSEIAKSEDLVKEKLIDIYKNNVKNVRTFFDGNFNKLKNIFISEMNTYSKSQDYESANMIKNKIRILDEIISPKILPENYLDDPYFSRKMVNNELKDFINLLNRYLQIKSVKKIECYDISHLHGTNSAGSMVTLRYGLPYKKLYRHFRLRKSRNSDTDSLSEIGKRRSNHFSDWGIPNLIIVDGGKPQVNAFVKVFSNFDIPVVGIAKRYENLIIPTENGYEEIRLKGGSLKLVQRIRNEAHRFARSYHHKLVSKTLLNS